MSKKIIVTNIAEKASEKTVKDFFLFCGKIKDFELIKEESSDTQIAYVTFERETAAKTALMLSSAVIGDSQIIVKSADDCNMSEDSSDEFEQEDKPKTAIFAEILASGFSLQDAIIDRGMEFDKKYGVRDTLKHYLSNIQDHLKSLDQKYQVSDVVTNRATDIDQKFAICSKSQQVMNTAHEKYTSFIETSTGKLIYDFLSQLGDIQSKARKIADDKRQERDFDPTPSHSHSEVLPSEPVQPFNL